MSALAAISDLFLRWFGRGKRPSSPAAREMSDEEALEVRGGDELFCPSSNRAETSHRRAYVKASDWESGSSIAGVVIPFKKKGSPEKHEPGGQKDEDTPPSPRE